MQKIIKVYNIDIYSFSFLLMLLFIIIIESIFDYLSIFI